jgi:hypothetical protein
MPCNAGSRCIIVVVPSIDKNTLDRNEWEFKKKSSAELTMN